jgi:hypothetical protein
MQLRQLSVGEATKIDIELDVASLFSTNNRGGESDAPIDHRWNPVEVQAKPIFRRRSARCKFTLGCGKPVENRLWGCFWHLFLRFDLETLERPVTFLDLEVEFSTDFEKRDSALLHPGVQGAGADLVTPLDSPSEDYWTPSAIGYSLISHAA